MEPPGTLTHLSGRYITAANGQIKFVSYPKPLRQEMPINVPLRLSHWQGRKLPTGEEYNHGVTCLPVPGVPWPEDDDY